MAVLQRIRNHSILLLVIVGLAMVAFIVGDLITSSSSIVQSRRDKVVTVDGQKVTYEEYEAARQRRQDFVKAMQGQELDNQSTQQLNNQVYQEIVTKNLIEKACKKFGLVVSPRTRSTNSYRDRTCRPFFHRCSVSRLLRSFLIS